VSKSGEGGGRERGKGTDGDTSGYVVDGQRKCAKVFFCFNPVGGGGKVNLFNFMQSEGESTRGTKNKR